MPIDNDLVLVIGMLLIFLSIPPLLAAYAESNPPRAGATMVLVGGLMIGFALTRNIGGYRFGDLPDVVISVIERYIK